MDLGAYGRRILRRNDPLIHHITVPIRALPSDGVQAWLRSLIYSHHLLEVGRDRIVRGVGGYL